MKQLFISIVLILLLIFPLSACNSKDNNSDLSIPVSESPTGRSDGKTETTYVFFDGILYIRDYTWLASSDSEHLSFEFYSKEHSMNYLGKITELDEDIPSKNFSAHEAQIGDKLYKDENDNLFLVRKDGYIIALIPANNNQKDNTVSDDLSVKKENAISVNLHGFGKDVTIDDKNDIERIIQLVNGIDFKEAESSVINLPGAVSLRIIVNYDNGEKNEITLPARRVNDKVYDCEPNCITLFSDFI